MDMLFSFKNKYCERRVFLSRTVILFTFVFGVLPISKERITSFLLDFCFSLSLAFSK